MTQGFWLKPRKLWNYHLLRKDKTEDVEGYEGEQEVHFGCKFGMHMRYIPVEIENSLYAM